GCCPEPAVRGEEGEVAAQRGVERSRAARGREREDCEARLLLRGRSGLLQLGERPLRVGTALGHGRGRRRAHARAPAPSIAGGVETKKKYCESPSWISRATRARSSATARPNSAW